MEEEENVREYTHLNERTYKGLFDEYFGSLRNFLYYKTGDSELAEDIAQDTFIKLWENRQKIDLNTVKSFLYRIGSNLAINQLKRQQLQYKFVSNSSMQSENLSPEFIMRMKEYEEKLNGVIGMMTEGSREVFLMNRIEGMKYKEIAERLGISVKAVEKRMSNALKIVHEQLGVNV